MSLSIIAVFINNEYLCCALWNRWTKSQVRNSWGSENTTDYKVQLNGDLDDHGFICWYVAVCGWGRVQGIHMDWRWKQRDERELRLLFLRPIGCIIHVWSHRDSFRLFRTTILNYELLFHIRSFIKIRTKTN